MQRYRTALDNLILTNYLEFRWYVEGEARQTAIIGRPLSGGQIKRISDLTDLETLLAGFLARRPVKLASSLEVAQRMAKLTHMIRTIAVQAFATGQASPLVKDLRQALARSLLPGLDEPNRVEEFADIYAQTIAYGLFAARCNHPDGRRFRRSTAAAEIPKTNPFLRRLFTVVAGPDLADEPYIGFVKDLVQLLDQADMEAILADFGRRTRREDPIVHFYETFLATYDPRIRELRGVYYTPEPVVSYIVRSKDHLLQTRFGLPQGLTDVTTVTHNGQPVPKMLLLDPAAGTGTFLYGVIEQIREKFSKQGNVGMWSGYVKEHLLKKLHGFELLMVPYAVAHFKLALQLAGQDLDESGRHNWVYDFGSDERLKIYLTNTLEEVEEEVQTLFGLYRIITEEAKAAAEIKQDLPILVVMGNPPYSGHSANRSWMINEEGKRVRTFIGEILQDYYRVDGKPLGERNPKYLQDDYVKFIRWGQWRIEQTGAGILAFITNHGYLDNPTFRGMRQNLMNTFTDIYLLDLHGNVKKKETAPDGGKDNNVFDIQQGVAIGLFVKEPGKAGPARVHHANLWGRREAKYGRLASLDVASTEWLEIKPQSPFYLFIPQDLDLLPEYEKGWRVSEIFPVNSTGVKTHRDHFALDFEYSSLRTRIENFRDTSRFTDEEIAQLYKLRDTRDWKLTQKRRALSKDSNWEAYFTQCLYRPFDVRAYYNTENVVELPRQEVMQHILAGDNIGLIFMRQVALHDEYTHFGVSNLPVDNRSFYSNKGVMNFAPLYLYPDPNQLFDASPWPPGKEGRTPNLNPKFVQEVERRLGLSFSPEGAAQTFEVSETSKVFTPEDIFHYIYAVFHSPTYRDRYAEFLKIDFPRVPLTSDREQFAALVKLGQQLVKLHLLEQIPPSPVSYPERGSDTVAKGYPKYNEAEQRVYINKTQYFAGVEPEVWEFYVGGYQVLEKWLKDRRGRKLSYNELSHYQHIVAALQRTGKLMAEIDETIPDWPLG